MLTMKIIVQTVFGRSWVMIMCLIYVLFSWCIFDLCHFTLTGRCDYDKLTGTRLCFEKYIEEDEDENKYCVGWTPYNSTFCESVDYKNRYFTANAWKFTNAMDIWGSPMLGEYTTYGGGGYILKFTTNRAAANLMMQEIKTHYWIDRGTRAIILEFTLYNGNTHYSLM